MIIVLLAGVAISGISESVFVAAVITILDVGRLVFIVRSGRTAVNWDAVQTAVAAPPGWRCSNC